MRSIRRALSLPLVIGVPVLVLLGGGFSSWFVADRLSREFDSLLFIKARDLSALVQWRGGANRKIEFNFSDELMPEFSSETRPEYFELWTESGRVIERSRSLRGAHLLRSPKSIDAPQIRKVELPDGRSGRLINLEFTPDGEDVVPGRSARRTSNPRDSSNHHEAWVETPNARVHLALATSTVELDSLIQQVFGLYFGITALVTITIILWLRVVLQRGLQPLDDFANQVANIGTTNLSERLTVLQEIEELAPLKNRTNALLESIEAALVRERSFSANVAHELRTPVAELKCLAEVGLLNPLDSQGSRGFLVDAKQIAENMERIVEQLLSLAIIEAGVLESSRELFDPITLVDDVCASLSVNLNADQPQLITRLPTGALILGDLERLTLMLRNLLENAIQYSPPNTPVEVDIEVTGRDCWSLSVTNTAEGLRQEDLPLMYNRFWRKELSRTSGRHSGLGLALVKSFAQALQLEVTTNLAESGRLKISISAGS